MDIRIVVKSIIEHQQLVMGPLALEQANKVKGIQVSDGDTMQVSVTGSDQSAILTELVKKYEALFGQASVEVCKDAIKEVTPRIPNDQLPGILR